MDKKTFFHKVSQMRAVQREYFKYCPLFPIDSEELVKFVLEKRPTLKGKPFRIAF